MPLPAVGSRAPDFRLASSAGGDLSLADLRGRRFVLYFYPRDNTPGCTQQACDFRDALAPLRAAGVEVYGVSKDSLASHAKFRDKFALTFPLLSDPDNTAARAYGVYGTKMMYGRAVEGTIRSSFLVGADGTIEGVWSPVRVPGHVANVLAAARGEAPPTARAAAASPAAKKSPAATTKRAASRAKR